MIKILLIAEILSTSASTGKKYNFYFPTISIKGMTVGKKEFALKNYSLVEDINNKLISAVHYLKKDSKGFFSKEFLEKKRIKMILNFLMK